MTGTTLQDAERELFNAQAGIAFIVARLGDHLASKQAPKFGLHGLEAAQWHLMQKHHWTPSQVKSMNIEDLHFALAEELAAWTPQKGVL